MASMKLLSSPIKSETSPLTVVKPWKRVVSARVVFAGLWGGFRGDEKVGRRTDSSADVCLRDDETGSVRDSSNGDLDGPGTDGFACLVGDSEKMDDCRSGMMDVSHFGLGVSSTLSTGP